jgi:hypothetical protein
LSSWTVAGRQFAIGYSPFGCGDRHAAPSFDLKILYRIFIVHVAADFLEETVVRVPKRDVYVMGAIFFIDGVVTP